MDNATDTNGASAPQPTLDDAMKPRADSSASQQSQTAQDFISQQLQLEADAREALPYQFDTCTRPLGPLRQAIFACLTCTPPPASIHQQFMPAGVCYSCSISCHGEHELVELFTKRDFVCDCGTTRLENGGTPCNLRFNVATQTKGGVTGEPAREGNEYNHNFQGTFCACGETYDPEKEKGTMFQCLGLGKLAQGGCGEDWWHPECLMGKTRAPLGGEVESNGLANQLAPVKEEEEKEDGGVENGTNNNEAEAAVVDETPLPKGFPAEDDFDHLICYKCVEAFPWIKAYAGSSGFLPGVVRASPELTQTSNTIPGTIEGSTNGSKKRRAEDDESETSESDRKRIRSQDASRASSPVPTTNPIKEEAALPKHTKLSPPTNATISLFLKEDFREHFCRCAECFPRLAQDPQLLEEEETYEPPVSESDGPHNHDDDQRSIAGRSVNSGSLLDRGEAALSSMDRVRAIEGVMAYNHVRDKVKAFLQPFADSGQPVGIEDVKSYFAKLRGDEQAMREAAMGAGRATEADHRREQEGQ